MKRSFILVALFCAACSGPAPMLSDANSISFEKVSSSKLDDVTRLAQDHCETFGKRAKLRHYNTALRIVEFRCLS